jgi:hypothetical protein
MHAVGTFFKVKAVLVWVNINIYGVKIDLKKANFLREKRKCASIHTFSSFVMLITADKYYR